jgi:sucrose-6-phosphate hydrolase SacC (GH32 family)
MIYSPSANTTDIRFSKDIRGPYRPAPSPCIDTPILYAAKRMADGKRHIITGWIRDLNGDRDNGGFRWGGTQSLPREVYAGADGQLLFRPVPEATAVFTRTALDLAAKPAFGSSAAARWAADDGTLTGVAGANAGSQCTFDVPDNYMLQCKVQLDAQAKFSLAMREQDRDGAAYRLTLRPGMQEAEISSPAFRFPRKIAVDATQPITIQAFVQGNIIECFIGDAFAFSCRAYDYRKGKLGLNVSGGKVKVLDLTVKTE